jgi:hypothetical protein
VRGRLHHLISLKIKDKLHIFDYATDNRPFELGATVCHINANKNFNYVLEFGATKVENIDLKAKFLGKTSDKFEGKDILAALKNFVYEESGYEHSYYNLHNHNCRTFSHTVAIFLGVEESYLKIAKNFSCAKRPQTSCDITIQQ